MLARYQAAACSLVRLRMSSWVKNTCAVFQVIPHFDGPRPSSFSTRSLPSLSSVFWMASSAQLMRFPPNLRTAVILSGYRCVVRLGHLSEGDHPLCGAGPYPHTPGLTQFR